MTAFRVILGQYCTVYRYWSTLGLILQSLQLQEQVNLGGLGWSARSRVRVDQYVSIVRVVEMPVLVCLLSSWDHVIEVEGLSLKFIVQMTGTLWM